MIKKQSHNETHAYIPVFLVLFGLIFVRYCYYGFEYYYQLDDYIQYHNYKEYNDDLWSLLKSLGMLSARPLAGIFDVYIWSKFYGFMIFAVSIISALYALSSIFLHKVFSKHFGTGYLFFIVFAILPLGFEGLYWISASSRIAVGLFFASLSLLFFDLWCEEGKKNKLVLFAVIQFISFCFYEQIVMFSGAATFVIILCYLKKRGRYRARWGAIMFLNAAIYFAVTKIAPSGVYGERMSLYLPWHQGYLENCFFPALGQMTQVFINGNVATLGKGLIRGFSLLVSEPNVIYMLFVMALCYSFFMIVKNTGHKKTRFLAQLFAGIFLAIAPLLLFFVLKNPWFSLRNAVSSFCGIALIADALINLVFRKLKNGNIYYASFILAFSLICCIASISELYDYRETTIADTKISKAAADIFNNIESDEISEVDIWLLNIDASYVQDGNFYFHEHNYGSTSSDWALTGAVRAISGRGDIPYLTPVSVHRDFHADEKEISEAMTFWYDGFMFRQVMFNRISDCEWDILDDSDIVLGKLTYSNGIISIESK